MVAYDGARAESRRERGDLVLWLVVWCELAAFGMLLFGFLVMSFLHPETFAVAKLHLDSRLASVSTLVLVTSGWLAAEAVRSSSKWIRRMALLGAALLGFAFLAVRLVEYQGEMRFLGDDTFNAFFELYFLITGFHLAHVGILGLIMLLLARHPGPSNVRLVTTIWQVIGMVWLVIFPVIYLG